MRGKEVSKMPMVNFHAARVRDPADFLDDKKAWATLTIKPGIELVTAKLKKDGISGPMTAQAYRFDKSKFTVDQAKKWLKKHKVKTILFEPAKEEVKETTTVANIAPRVLEKCWGKVWARRKKTMGMSEQKGAVVASGKEDTWGMKGSYEELRAKIRKALEDSHLYGKYPEIMSTFPKKVFVAADDGRYFVIEYGISGDEVKIGTAAEIEKQVKFVMKEIAESIRSELFFEGGPGSGNWGHKGRPGKKGGSLDGGGGGGGGDGGKGIAPHKLMVKGEKVHASKYYDSSGGLKNAEYRKLTGNQKTIVLNHGVQKYKEQYVPKANWGKMSAKDLATNRKVGAFEGMRRAALDKAKKLEKGSKEYRAALHAAISLQQQATSVIQSAKGTGGKITAAVLASIRTASRPPA
jgi:hypothetical protein